MKLASSAIKNLRAVSVKEINDTLLHAPTNNAIDISKGDSASVGVGEYVLYGDNKSLNLAQILCIDGVRDVLKKQLKESNIPPQKYKNDRTRVALVRECRILKEISSPSLDRTKNNNHLVPPNMKEAIPTAKCRYVLVENIKKIAFLFHVDHIKEGKYNPHLIDNAFAVRRRTDPSGRRITIKADNFTSFYNDCSYSKRIWDIITNIHIDQRKLLGCGGLWNGRTKYSHHCGINKEFFYYTQHMCKEFIESDQILLLNRSGKKPMKIMHPDLSNENKRLSEKTTILRAIEEPAIKRLRSIVGMVGVANPDPAPTLRDVDKKKANPIKPLYNSTQVRITTTDPEVVDAEEGRDYNRPAPVVSTSTDIPTEEEDPSIQEKANRQMRNRRCPFPGIDISHSVTSNGRTDISICYKFKKVRGDHKAVSDLIGYKSVDDPIPPDEATLELEVEHNLEYNNIIHEVIRLLIHLVVRLVVRRGQYDLISPSNRF